MLLKVGNSYIQQHEIARYLMVNMSRSFLFPPPPPPSSRFFSQQTMLGYKTLKLQ